MIATEIESDRLNNVVNLPETSRDDAPARGIKAAPKTARTQASQRDDSEPQDLTMRSSVGFNDWVADMAEECRTTVADVIEMALTDFGERIKGLGEAPPRLPRRNKRVRNR